MKLLKYNEIKNGKKMRKMSLVKILNLDKA